MNVIHPTAIIDPNAILGTDNTFGPYCVVGPNVVIGNGNTFTSHVSVGQPAQHRTNETHGWTVIGNNNVFREFVTIHAGTVRKTSIEDNCYIMACAHIPHDAILESDVTMANGALLAGHTHVMQGATLSLGCIVHQYQTIGSYSILGMGTIVTKYSDVVPGRKFAGSPAKDIGDNSVGLQRANVDPLKLAIEVSRYYSLVRK